MKDCVVGSSKWYCSEGGKQAGMGERCHIWNVLPNAVNVSLTKRALLVIFLVDKYRCSFEKRVWIRDRPLSYSFCHFVWNTNTVLSPWESLTVMGNVLRIERGGKVLGWGANVSNHWSMKVEWIILHIHLNCYFCRHYETYWTLWSDWRCLHMFSHFIHPSPPTLYCLLCEQV